jgi:hypothetical protein
MFETFVITIFTLVVALYVQARATAREIRVRRAKPATAPDGNMLL